ncbi:hypothetical protein Pcaca03_13640 [Pectobacterium carotovorum subsp. carotovorum]|uniref:Uncharacterized protein n=1 Tax=Pectobacterium carotovorum subsp. carotovorum TaxID=555 RepID=A0AAI9KY21_PECCC|nr:hypothetical protein SOASR016_10590 [Pectobacterium carotovorum subsp. carotovorum]GLV68920.1 hypothetical protein Pcaca03_13640 [Pectobacterium carotovorum subsp. carotovorum]
MSFNLEVCQRANHSVFDGGDELTNAELATLQVNQHVHDLLTGAVVGYLTASVALNHGNIAGHEDMLGFACLTLREYAGMLNQPDFIWGFIITSVGEIMHRQRDGFIRLYVKLAYDDLIL